MVADAIEQLRRLPAVALNPALSESSIADFEARTGTSLPAEFHEFYRICDGINFDDGAAQILPLQAVEGLKKSIEEFGIRRSWNYVPFTEDNTSNPVCVCCDGPLKGYLVQVFHDDSPQIKWRGLSSLLKAMVGQAQKEEYFFEDAPADFRAADRTDTDTSAARTILAAVHVDGIPDGDRDDGCRFAAWLFGGGQASEIGRLLETENEYVRRDVVERLSALKSREAGEIVRAHNRDTESFTSRCRDLLEAAGIRAQAHEKTRLQVLEPAFWVNMEAFYSERHRSDFDAFFTGRIRHLIDQRRNVN